MEMSRKLIVIGVLAVLGLLLKIVVFTSPGWTGVHVPVRKHMNMEDDIVTPQLCDDGFRTNPVPEGAPRLPPCSEMVMDKDKRMSMMTDHHRKRDCGPGIHMSLGLWYAVTCTTLGKDKNGHGDSKNPDMEERRKRSHHGHREEPDRDGHDDDDHDKREKECHIMSYKHADEVADNLPTDVQSLAIVVKNIAKYTDKMMWEFRVESTVGLATSFIGIIALIVYARGSARSRCSGIVSFISLLTSGVIFLVAVGKVASILIMAHTYLETDGYSDLNVHFTVPWCLILAVIGAILTMSATFGLLLVLSRGHNIKDLARPYEITSSENGKYERFVNQDAGPLPLKLKF